MHLALKILPGVLKARPNLVFAVPAGSDVYVQSLIVVESHVNRFVHMLGPCGYMREY